jgi:tRNA pseudouridine55 synthase
LKSKREKSGFAFEQQSPLPTSSGIILLNKNPGITSFDTLRDIKRALGTGKVGHTGTLDKFAEGLLIVLAGKALKLSQWFTNCDKEYTGRICFGEETDTLDPEGEVIAQAPVPSREAVEKLLPQFTGDIMQAPPAYSAIHINGKRASALARSGQSPEMKKRPVTIHKLEIRNWQPPFADIYVSCSSGTYIRSLARDIALAAKSRAHLLTLKRTRVGGFRLEDAITVSSEQGAVSNEEGFLRPIDKSVISALGLPWFEVTSNKAQNIINGKPLAPILENLQLSFTPKSSDFHAAIFIDELLLSIIEKKTGNWLYGCVFA